jgi:hypothetical protein
MTAVYVRQFVLPYSPVANLFHYNQFDEEDKAHFSEALQLFTAPLADDGALYNPLLQLSLHNHFEEWCSRNAVTYYENVLHLLLHIHQIDSSRVFLKNIIYNLKVDQLPATTIKLPPRMKSDLVKWFRYSSAPLFICPCSVLNLVTGNGHNVCVLFYKSSNDIQYMYIESFGEAMKIDSNVNTLFQVKLQELFSGYSLSEVLFTCPDLQIGANCVQWQLMFLVLFAMTPDLFQSASDVLEILERQAQLNIVLFTLYMYMYMLSATPHFTTTILFNAFNMLPQFYEEPEVRVQLDLTVRDLLSLVMFVQPLPVALTPPELVARLLNIEKSFMTKGLLPFTDQVDSMFEILYQYTPKTPQDLIGEQIYFNVWSKKMLKKVQSQFARHGIHVFI